MAKLILTDVGTLANPASAQQAINDNFNAIETAFENTLSRDGTLPNTMEADLDVNGNSILNVARGSSDADATNIGHIVDLIKEQVSQPVYEDPIAYAAGLRLFKNTQLVIYNGDIYAPITSELPFTTSGTFETAKFRLIVPGMFLQSGTGAVARTVNEKLGEWVSVKDYGAVGDGVADDTAAIMAAIATNKSVYFPNGTYLHTGISVGRANNAINLFGAGWTKSKLKCVTPGAHSISLINDGTAGQHYWWPSISDLWIEGTASTGCGIYCDGVVLYSFENLFILYHGSHGIQFTDTGTPSSGSYLGWVRGCFIRGNGGSGIHQVGTDGTNQQNASWISNCEINGNAHGITMWGLGLSVLNTSVEGNIGYGIRLINDGASFYSANNLSIKNCYFEHNDGGHIYVRTGISGTYGIITGLEITDNYFRVNNLGNPTYVPVQFVSQAGGLNQVRMLDFRRNSFSWETAPTVIADFGGRLGSDCRIAPQHGYGGTPNYATVYDQYTNLGHAKLESLRGLSLSGWVNAKGGTGITYAGPSKSNNITANADTYFPLAIPLGTDIIQFMVPVETDSTNYTITFTVSARAYDSANAAFTTRLVAAKSALSGSQNVKTDFWDAYNDNYRQLLSNMDCYLRIQVTLTTPGTYLYLGNPTVFYNEA